MDDVVPAPLLVQTPAGLIQAPGLIINPQLGSASFSAFNQEPVKPQKKVGRGELVLDEDEQDVDMPYVSFNAPLCTLVPAAKHGYRQMLHFFVVS